MQHCRPQALPRGRGHEHPEQGDWRQGCEVVGAALVSQQPPRAGVLLSLRLKEFALLSLFFPSTQFLRHKVSLQDRLELRALGVRQIRVVENGAFQKASTRRKRARIRHLAA